MYDVYVIDYFLFSFFSIFGVLQMALAKPGKPRFLFGAAVLFISYFWFFTARDRNVHTWLEGTQLSVIFAICAVFAVWATRIFKRFEKKK